MDRETAEKYVRVKREYDRAFREEPRSMAARKADDEYQFWIHKLGLMAAEEAERMMEGVAHEIQPMGFCTTDETQ